LAGGTLCYLKTLWRINRFPDRATGADLRFIWSDHPKKSLALPDHTIYIALMHPGNTSPRRVQHPAWQAYPADSIRNLLGADWQFYSDLSQNNGA